MDFWVNNPKNKMHLAWKLVFTHLYMPDAIIYIHDISVILQKIGRKAWHKGHAISWQHEGKQKKRRQLFFFLPLCWEILTLIWQKLPWSPYTDKISKIGQPKATNKQFIGKKKRGDHMRTKADYVLVKSFFFILLPTHNESWLTSLKKSSEVCISHNFSFLYLFFLNFTAVPWVFIDGFSPKKSKMCFCIVSMRFVFPFLVFFIFLLAGTFNAEPLLVLRGRCDDPDTRPEDITEEESWG